MWRTHGRVLCFIVLMGSGGLLRAQTNDEVYVKDKPDRTNYFEVVREYERYFANVPKTQLKIPGWKQYKRWEYFWSKRVDKDGNFPRPDISYIERKNIDAFHAKAKEDNPLDIVATPNWKPVGPSGAPSSGGGAGRLNCITLSTKNKDLMWVGSAGGGAWKSTDGGKTWKAMTDDLPNLAVNDVALDPNDENTVYLGTGDDWGSGIVDFSQRELFRISFSIGIMTNPIAQIDVAAVVRQVYIKHQMTVTEYKKINVFFLQHLFAINGQPFIFFTQKFFIRLLV